MKFLHIGQVFSKICLVGPAGIDDLIQFQEGGFCCFRLFQCQVAAGQIGGIQAANGQIISWRGDAKKFDGLFILAIGSVAVCQIAAANSSGVGTLDLLGYMVVVTEELVGVQLHVEDSKVMGIL